MPSNSFDSSWAIVVGIDKFANTILHSRYYGSSDAKSVTKILEGLGFPRSNIKLLLNEQATLENVRSAFLDMNKKVDRNDRFFFYWAGHGETENTGGKDVGYLFPYNGKKEELQHTCISIDEIYRLTEKINANQMLFMIDACVGGLSKNLKNATGKCLQILTSGSKGELLVENKQWKHSAFGKLLIEQFKRAQETPNQYDILLPSKLHEYISPRVTAMSQQGAYKGQHPQLVSYGNCATPFFYNRDEKMYALKIIDVPKSSRIFINGRLVASGKNEYTQNVFSGNYKIEVEAPGRQKYFTTVKVNRDVVVRPTLHKILNYTLESTQPGANVIIDGKNVGVTPLTTQLISGEHSVILTKDGYDTLNFITSLLNENKTEKVDLQQKQFHKLTLTGLPKDNLVFINGKQYFTDSAALTVELPQEQYIIKIESPGVHRFGASFVLEKDTVIVPQFIPLVNYTIKTEPESVRIKIDNEQIGISPVNTYVTEGLHSFTFTKKNYDSLHCTINVSKNDTLLHSVLRPVSQYDSLTTEKNDANTAFSNDSIVSLENKINTVETQSVADTFAHLEITVLPPDAYLYIDGERIQTILGKTKVNIIPGNVDIFADFSGYDSYSFSETVLAGETKSITIELIPSTPISKWWIWGGVSTLVVGGSTYLILLNQPEKPKEHNFYGLPPGFPIDP